MTRDQRGLSTLEYAVLFVVILIGALAVWSKIARTLETQVSAGTSTLNRDLASALARGAGSSENAPQNGAFPTRFAPAATQATSPPAVPPAGDGRRVGNPPSANHAQPASVTQAEIISTNLPAVQAPAANSRSNEVTHPYTTAGSPGLTDATYTVGPPKQPDIFHDNGFLQNPNDPTDPKPMPTRPATFEERKDYEKQAILAEAGVVATQVGWPKDLTPEEYQRFLKTPDGVEAYYHFMRGNGADQTISYDKFVKEDPAGQTTLNNAIRDTQRGSEEVYRQMVANDPTLANKPVTFQMTGGNINVGAPDDPIYPYPETENWQKAIGRHDVWNSATVTVTPPATHGGSPSYSMNYNLHFEDRYNFNRGNVDIATGKPDELNGRYEESGLAHQYTNYGSLKRDVTWTGGEIPSSTAVATQGRP